jgi:hypothetical protein
MKTFKTVAAAITASICVFTIASAVAQGNAASTDQGHYEWRHAPRSDPRVPLQGQGTSGCRVPSKWQPVTAT